MKFFFNKKGQTFSTITIGIICMLLLSGITYNVIRESLDKTSYRIKEFHAFVLCQSEINKELSKDNITNKDIQYTVKIENNYYTVKVKVSDVSTLTKRIDVEVIFEHNGNQFTKQLSVERKI